jgi:hypothetical protein
MLKMGAQAEYSCRCRRSRKGTILFFNNALFSLPNQTYSGGRIVENGAEDFRFVQRIDPTCEAQIAAGGGSFPKVGLR